MDTIVMSVDKIATGLAAMVIGFFWGWISRWFYARIFQYGFPKYRKHKHL